MYDFKVSIKRKVAPWVYPEEVQLSEQFAYGHREVLISTHDLDPSGIFLASIPHGWGPDVPGRPYPKTYSKKFSEYPIFTWSARTTADLTLRGYRKPIFVGSPWAHLVTALGKTHVTEPKSSSQTSSEKVLYFPSHSIPGGTHSHNVNLTEIVAKLRPGKITVCLFWLDFIDPRVRKHYSEIDCELFCVGYKGSTGFDTPWAPVGGREMFLGTLFDLIDQHDTVIFESISTPFWYAASLKKQLYICDLKMNTTWWGNSENIDLSINNSELLQMVHPELVELRRDELIATSDLLYECAKKELGWEGVENLVQVINELKLVKSGCISDKLVNPIRLFISEKISKNTIT